MAGRVRRWFSGSKRAGPSPGKSGDVMARGVTGAPVWVSSGGSVRREKLRREAHGRPYPKPTLVVR